MCCLRAKSEVSVCVYVCLYVCVCVINVFVNLSDIILCCITDNLDYILLLNLKII